MTVLTLPPLASTEAVRRWDALGAEARDELLMRLEEKAVIPRPLQLYAGELDVDNDGVVQVLERCRGVEPRDWPYAHLVLVTTLWLWDVSKVAISELNQTDLGFSVLDEFFRAKHRVYATILGVPPALTGAESVFDVAAGLVPLRERIERDYLRCMRINGATWERREWFLPLSRVEPDTVPDAVSTALEARLGTGLPAEGDHRERFGALTRRCIETGTNPAEILVALAEHAVTDPELDADYAIITCARGNKLDEPHTIEMRDVMSHTAIRDGLDPAARGIRLKPDQIRNAISQRMRYNVVCRVRNYSPDREERMRAQAFQNPDLGVMEDAHHNGHRANGVRFIARAPLVFEVGPERRVLKGLADFRVNRATHDDSRQFTERELVRVLRVSWWMKVVAETSWTAGVWFDEKYCTNATTYEDRDGGRLDRRKAILGR